MQLTLGWKVVNDLCHLNSNGEKLLADTGLDSYCSKKNATWTWIIMQSKQGFGFQTPFEQALFWSKPLCTKLPDTQFTSLFACSKMGGSIGVEEPFQPLVAILRNPGSEQRDLVLRCVLCFYPSWASLFSCFHLCLCTEITDFHTTNPRFAFTFWCLTAIEFSINSCYCSAMQIYGSGFSDGPDSQFLCAV